MIELPPPNEFELKPYNKAYYFKRLMGDMEIHNKLNISHYIVADYISANYDSWFLNGIGLKFKR